MKNEYSIDFKVEYNDPLEIDEFTKALRAFSSGYKKFLHDKYGSQQPLNANLYIEKIQEKCVLVTFVEYSDMVIPVIADLNTVLDFGNHLKSIFNHFNNKDDKGDAQEPTLDSKDIDNFSSILAPGTNQGNHITINLNGKGNTINLLSADDKEANAMAHRMDKEKKKFDKSNSNIHRKQLLYYEQAKKIEKSRTVYYGVIENLYPKELRVVFQNDKLDRKRMLTGSINPLKASFIVDVEVQTKKGEPMTYKILRLHEIIPDEE